MKVSIGSRIRWTFVILFLFSIIQGAIILNIIHVSEAPLTIRQNIQNTIYVTIFIEFIFVLILFFYLPVFMKKTFSIIHNIISVITEGNYRLYEKKEDIPTSSIKEINEILDSILKMLNSILTYDSLKREKIVEHNSRINAILKLSKDGFIILDLKGKIVYMNEIISTIFPSITENSNMLDTNFPPEIENNIKKYIMDVLKKQTNIRATQFFVPSLKKHIRLESAVVRNSEGKIKGAVIAFTNLERKEK